MRQKPLKTNISVQNNSPVNNQPQTGCTCQVTKTDRIVETEWKQITQSLRLMLGIWIDIGHYFVLSLIIQFHEAPYSPWHGKYVAYGRWHRLNSDIRRRDPDITVMCYIQGCNNNSAAVLTTWLVFTPLILMRTCAGLFLSSFGSRDTMAACFE